MSEMNLSRVSVALSQQEYTTPPESNSRVLGSTRLEDRVITHQLNAEEISNLIKEEIYLDLDITNDTEYSVVRSDGDEVYAMVKTYSTDNIILTNQEYDKIMLGASSSDYAPLFFAATPNGIFQFSLELLNPKFEDYVDHDAGTDIKVAELNAHSAVQILDWYPEFSSQEEYLDTLLDASMDKLEDVPMWEEGDEW